MKKIIGIFILLGIVTSIIASNLSHKNIPDSKATPPPCPCSDATIIAKIADCRNTSVNNVTYDNLTDEFTVYDPPTHTYSVGIVTGTSCPGIPKPMCCSDISVSGSPGCTYTVNCDF